MGGHLIIWPCSSASASYMYARVNFVQVAMLRFDGRGLITRLEEYWTSKAKYGKGERGENKRAVVRAGKRKPPKAYGWLGSYAMR